jgi:hypothetical protein
MTLDASGNLGIGTTSPPSRLSVAGEFGTSTTAVTVHNNSAASASNIARLDFRLNNTFSGNERCAAILGLNPNAASNNGGALVFSVSSDGTSTTPTERARIDSSGNFGIGTTSPRTKLDVAGNIYASAGSQIQITGSAGSNGLQLIGNDASESVIGTMSAQALVFRTGSTERARITSDGNFLVGNNNLNGKITAQETTTSKTVLYGYASNTSYVGSVLDVQSGTASSTSWNMITGYSDISTARFIVRGNGNVLNTNNSYGALSDIKLKENIVDATPKLEKLNQIRVVNYNFIGDEQKQLGVIAQELETVFPSMVDETPDRDAEGNDLGTTTKSVKYSVFVPMLIKAIQEQQALITQLQADVAALKGQA